MTRPALHNNWRERQRRAAHVQAWIEEYGYLCPGYLRLPHQATDLCADHVHPVGAGGSEHGPLTVLCRSCNSRKQDGRRTPKPATVVRSRNW